MPAKETDIFSPGLAVPQKRTFCPCWMTMLSPISEGRWTSANAGLLKQGSRRKLSTNNNRHGFSLVMLCHLPVKVFSLRLRVKSFGQQFHSTRRRKGTKVAK